MGIGGNWRGMTPPRTAVAGAGAFPAEVLHSFLQMVNLCISWRFAPLMMHPNEACFASAFSFLALLLNSVSHMRQKNQYMYSLKVNHPVPSGIWINSLNHTFFTSLDFHFKYPLQPSEDKILLFPSGFALIKKELC